MGRNRNRNQNPAPQEQNAPDQQPEVQAQPQEVPGQNPEVQDQADLSDQTETPIQHEEPQDQDAPDQQGPKDNDSMQEKRFVKIRHKTPHKIYRRAGLILKQQPDTYPVTEEQLAILEKDCWVEIIK